VPKKSINSCEKNAVKQLWHQNFSGSARLVQTFSGFGSTKIWLGFRSNVFRLNFCGFGTGAQVYAVYSRNITYISDNLCTCYTGSVITYVRYQMIVRTRLNKARVSGCWTVNASLLISYRKVTTNRWSLWCSPSKLHTKNIRTATKSAVVSKKWV